MRVLLFKRFESSVYAFRETVKRLLKIHQSFVASLDAGFVPAGEDAQYILYESDILEEGDLVDALREVSKRYDVSDFDVKSLRAHIEHDIELLQEDSETGIAHHSGEGRETPNTEEAACRQTAKGRETADLHAVRRHGTVPLREPEPRRQALGH